MHAGRRPPYSRRRFLATSASAVGLLASSGCVGAFRLDQSDAKQTAVSLTPVAEGFTAPLGFEDPPGDDPPVVVDQTGVAYAVSASGRRETPFLDVRDRMVDIGGYSERGLLGLAFHPEYERNRRLYVRYSSPPRPGTPDGYSHTFVLSEFRATADGTRVRPDSERVVLEIPQPQSNHNAGSVLFGPDGYLYVGVGDGGGGGDTGTGHVDDWYEEVDGGNGQDVAENLLGSVVRIDVDATDGGEPYGIPADNPLVGRAGLDEHFAWGFRNPWRMSFDGDRLFVADVGQNRWEEVDLVERGGNYGWNVREGAHCYGADSCPSQTPDGERLRDPIIEYPHSGNDGVNGIAVVGGFVYRRSTIASLTDAYVFADWRSRSADGGALFAARDPGDDGLWPVEKLRVANRQGGEVGANVLSLGRDGAGRLYVLTSTGEEGGGVVSRLDPEAGRSAVTGTTQQGDVTTDGGTTSAGATDDGGGDEGRETAGTSAPASDATTTNGTGAPGFGALAALVGVGGAVANRLRRRD